MQLHDCNFICATEPTHKTYYSNNGSSTNDLSYLNQKLRKPKLDIRSSLLTKHETVFAVFKISRENYVETNNKIPLSVGIFSVLSAFTN